MKLGIDYILDFFVFPKGFRVMWMPRLRIQRTSGAVPGADFKLRSPPFHFSVLLFLLLSLSLSHPPSSPCTAPISYKSGGVRDWQAMRGESRPREKQRRHLKSHRPFLMTPLQRVRITVYKKRRKAQQNS